jgi:uncharacterized protein with PIN domain
VAELLDAYALVALIADEPAAPIVEEILRSGEAAITSMNLAETVDVARRVHAHEEEHVRDAVEPLLLGGHISLIAPGGTTAWRAVHLRSAYYDRRARAVSIADCFLLAVAGADDRIVTADRSIVDIAQIEGIAVLPLPNSAGHLP